VMRRAIRLFNYESASCCHIMYSEAILLLPPTHITLLIRMYLALKICLDTSTLVKSIIGQREYHVSWTKFIE
jgi:hypothetical protein